MALNSVHTNVSALVALQSLNKTNTQMQAVQTRVSTGMRVSSAKEDSASFAIAQGLRGNLRGYEAIQEQLSKAKGTMSVSLSSATKISDTLNDIRAVVTKLADENVTGSQRTQYQGDYNALISEIQRFIAGSSFNGINLLDATATDINVISNLSGGSLTLRANNLTAGVVTNLTPITTAASAQALLAAGGGLVLAETSMGTAMARLGADSRSLDNQHTYVGLLGDATEEGVGAIVDADLAKESARLQALQVRQQLGTQTLSIANQAPQILLSLFQ